MSAIAYPRFCQIGSAVAMSADAAISTMGIQMSQRPRDEASGRSVAGSRLSAGPADGAGPEERPGVTATTVAPQLSACRRI